MAKVYIGKEGYSYFLWDEETLEALDSTWLNKVEVPDELVEEYNRLTLLRDDIQLRLSKYYAEQ